MSHPPLQFQIKILEKLSPQEKVAIKEFEANSTELTPENTSAEEQKIIEDKFYSNKDLKKYILAYKDNKIISRVYIFGRKINFKGRKIKLGGFGSVKTRDEYRRRGVATALLEKAAAEIKKEKYDWAYLCTDVNNPFLVKLYGKFGFKVLNKDYTYLGKSGQRYRESDGMVAGIMLDTEDIFKSQEPFDIGVGNW